MNNEYSIQHLSYHLFKGELDDDLYHLVVNEVWYQESVNFDPSGRQYTEDINWAFQAIVEPVYSNVVE